MIQVIEQYKKVKESIPELIEASGYRSDYIAKRMGMRASNFSAKKQRGNWSEQEVEKLLEAITSANEEVINILDIKHIQGSYTGKTFSLEEVKKILA